MSRTKSMAPPQMKVRFHFRTTLHYLVAGLLAVIFVAPVALLFAPGAFKVLGIGYTVVYAVVLIPSSAAYLGMMVDAFLLFLHKRPIMLPEIFFQKAAGTMTERVVLHRWLQQLGEFSVLANPLSNLAGTALRQACEWRSEELIALMQEAHRRAARIQRRPAERPEPTPTMEFVGPLIERSAPELACI